MAEAESRNHGLLHAWILVALIGSGVSPTMAAPRLDPITGGSAEMTPGFARPSPSVVDGPAVHVVYPNGGEIVFEGTDVKFTWEASGPQPVPTVSLYVSLDYGATYQAIAMDIPNTGSLVWTVELPGTNSDYIPVYSAFLKVVATDTSNQTGEDTSDGPFAIYDFIDATVITQLDAEPADVGVTIRWQLTSRGWFTSTTLERAEAEVGPWVTVTAEAQQQGDATVVTDRTAVAGRTYWYHLVATTSTGSKTTFGPVASTAGAPPAFALAPVWPNPAVSGFRTELAVPRTAVLRLSLFDPQGREIAVIAAGTFAPGRYQVSWDGRGDRGVIPAGTYFLRLTAPGSHSVQRVVLTR